MVEADDYDDDGVSLKPCPFCGSPAEKLELTEEDGPHNAGGSVISCVKCQASSAVEFNFKETLRERWNSRTAFFLTPADGWLPIETAPKDGTIFDVWLGNDKTSEIDFYCTPGTKRSANWHWINGKFRPFAAQILTTFVVPTHWCPLPPPPYADE